MFWNAFCDGLKVFLYWETYVAGLEYLAIFLIPTIFIGMIMEKSERFGGAVGCLSTILIPILQVAAIAVFVLTLSPIIFGFADDAAWSFPWKVIHLAPGIFFKLVGILVVASIALAFVPILSSFQSFHTLVLGGIALQFILGIVDSLEPGVIAEHVDFLPGFWFSVGLIVIGGLMSWVGMLVVALIGTVMSDISSSLFNTFDSDFGTLIMFPFVAIFGFIPVFMYGAWLVAQVKDGL